MFAATSSHPLTDAVLLVVLIAGALLLAGAVLARRWRGPTALWVRSSAAVVALGAPVAFEVMAPAGTLEGLGRLMVLWPLVVLDGVLFTVWVLRVRDQRSA